MKPRSGKKKLPRIRRVSEQELPGFQLTARDVEILRAVYDYRAMTTPQIDALFFSPTAQRMQTGRASSRCLHRLKLLFHYGFLRRKEQAQTLSEGRKPLVYFLDRRGALYLAEAMGSSVRDLDWDRQGHEVGSLFLDHLLLSNDVRAAVTLAARTNDYALLDWRDERTLRRFHQTEVITITVEDRQGNRKRQNVFLVPDGYFVVDTPTSTYHQFVEIDRATTTLEIANGGQRDWARKVAAYLEYFRSGAYQTHYQTKSLRILTITTTEKRLAHLKQVTEKAGGKGRFWFTTIDKIIPETLLTASIWQKAGSDGLYSFVW